MSLSLSYYLTFAREDIEISKSLLRMLLQVESVNLISCHLVNWIEHLYLNLQGICIEILLFQIQGVPESCLQARSWLFEEIEDWYREIIFTVVRDLSNVPFAITTWWSKSSKTNKKKFLMVPPVYFLVFDTSYFVLLTLRRWQVIQVFLIFIHYSY